MNRPQERYLGGVCEAVGLKFKISPLLIRIVFLVATIFLTFPIFIYAILWLAIPNYREVINKKKRNKFQLIGLITGAFLGALIGFFGPVVILGGRLSGIIPIIYGIIGIPFGGLFGFMIGQGIVERDNKNCS